MAEYTTTPSGDYFVGKHSGYDYDYSEWTNATAKNYQLAQAVRQALVVGYVITNTSASPITFSFYSSITVISTVYVPANSTVSYFNEDGICLGTTNQVARTSSTGTGARTIISRMV